VAIPGQRQRSNGQVAMAARLLEAQVMPESLEMNIPLELAATKLLPLAEEATKVQNRFVGALVRSLSSVRFQP
jgi:hypothetical protein